MAVTVLPVVLSILRAVSSRVPLFRKPGAAALGNDPETTGWLKGTGLVIY